MNEFNFPESEDIGPSTARGIKTDGELGMALPGANANAIPKFEREVHGEDAKHAQFKETCKKCRGSGRFTSWAGRSLGECFSCKGKGHKSFVTSTEDRAKSKQSRVDRLAAKVEAFRTENADVAQWLDANTSFEFAQSLRAQLSKKGTLSDGQVAAVHKSIAKKAEFKKAQVVREATAAVVNVDKLAAAFENAATSLKWPKIRFIGFVISRASDTSRNPGALYVKADDATFLGKIVAGRFITSRECDAATEAKVLAVLADPEASAVLFGKEVGACSCCGRELTNQVSIDRGIGPICAVKFGW
tara:strand:- start:1214 stop:2119 length:906 start_codon:yes stop_codon:yes gene_type:complete